MALPSSCHQIGECKQHVSAAVVVLDINGVLADVRKKHAARPACRHFDLMLPSGQPVYFRPGIETLATYLTNNFRERTVLWTSRKAENAFPIENELYYRYGFRFARYLHGEDCACVVHYHPLKDANTLFRIMNLSPQKDVVVFVDDHVDRIDAGSRQRQQQKQNNVVLVPIETYDAKVDEEEYTAKQLLRGQKEKTGWVVKLVSALADYADG